MASARSSVSHDLDFTPSRPSLRDEVRKYLGEASTDVLIGLAEIHEDSPERVIEVAKLLEKKIAMMAMELINQVSEER